MQGELIIDNGKLTVLGKLRMKKMLRQIGAARSVVFGAVATVNGVSPLTQRSVSKPTKNNVAIAEPRKAGHCKSTFGAFKLAFVAREKLRPKNKNLPALLKNCVHPLNPFYSC